MRRAVVIRPRVYPRVGGGTGSALITPIVGLSPRGRGNRVTLRIILRTMRSIPAWAGEPSPTQHGGDRCAVYPRVGGGTRIGHSHVWRGGSIPAWAGEPWSLWMPKKIARVYPRVGGGTRMNLVLGWSFSGLSPRGRGNRWTQSSGITFLRSIPAWAGEPPQRRCRIDR